MTAVFPVPCECGKSALYAQAIGRDGQPKGKPKPIRQHCTTCHVSDDHMACEVCGKCMPPSGMYETVRLDARFCSSASRQKAYRLRVTAKKSHTTSVTQEQPELLDEIATRH